MAILGNPGGGREKSMVGGFSGVASGCCTCCCSIGGVSSRAGDEGDSPDSGLRDDKLPPPITSIAPAIFRAGGGPAFFTATEPAYFEFSLTTDIGRGAGADDNCMTVDPNAFGGGPNPRLAGIPAPDSIRRRLCLSQ